jgi:hypothetical protein
MEKHRNNKNGAWKEYLEIIVLILEIAAQLLILLN